MRRTEGTVASGGRSGSSSLAAVAGCAIVLAVVGLVEGGGNPGRMFGADWSRVDWPSVGTMLLVTAVVGLVLVPAAYLLLPRG